MNGRVFCGILLAVVAGCTVSMNPGGGGPSTPAITSVRVAHAAPGEPAFDVCVAGEVVLENARYGRITEYAESRAGAVTFRVVDAGGSCNDVIRSITFNLTPSQAYTVLVLDDVEPLPLLDDTSPVSSGRARIRVVNAGPNSLAIDVYEQGGLRFFDDIRYNEPDDYAYITVPAGTYELTIEPLGGSKTPYVMEPEELARGHVYTLFVFGQVDAGEDANPFTAELQDDGYAGEL
ncbi:MAG: DUF4397 domain-containing protein [Phycisphaerae bacterium]|nr:DUF4397 domain-containing protein [Phycisphaerae bacterium]